MLQLYGKLRSVAYRDARMIVISAMPKSGSSFLAQALEEIMGYKHGYFAGAFSNIEQELYLPRLIDAYGVGTVTQQHFKANSTNLEILRRYGIRPVVLVRNIFDALVSARDHLVQESRDNFPAVYATQDFATFDLERQMDFVIDMIAPWYVTYYVSWLKAEQGGCPFLWISYEEAIRDWHGTIARVLDYYGIVKSADDIDRALASMQRKPRRKTRLNQGVIGRGKMTLNENQRRRVLQLTRHYPSMDFSRVALHAGAFEA